MVVAWVARTDHPVEGASRVADWEAAGLGEAWAGAVEAGLEVVPVGCSAEFEG